jgi:hypothetical protein
MKTFAILVASVVLAGCAASYQLTLMPRDSGKLYYGTADDFSSGEGRIAIEIDAKAYAGTWVQSTPERTAGYVSGGWGWRRFGGAGAMVSLDNPHGGSAKALLQAADGSGLRCDLVGLYGQGGGVCRDDRGREFDVQIRRTESRKPS